MSLEGITSTNTKGETMTSIPQMSEIEFCRCFNIDIGDALLNQAKHVRHTDRDKARELVKMARKHKGHDLWYLTPRQRGGGQVVDFKVSAHEEMKRKGSEVREARLAQLTAAYAELEADEVSPFDLEQYEI